MTVRVKGRGGGDNKGDSKGGLRVSVMAKVRVRVRVGDIMGIGMQCAGRKIRCVCGRGPYRAYLGLECFQILNRWN